MASNPITNTWTPTKIRVRLAMRNRTFLFFSLIMPLGFLFFFVLVFSKGSTGWIGYILDAVLTLTVMGSFWGLSVQLVMFREAGILRRFRLAPLGAGPMLASSILANYLLVVPSVIIEILACKWALHMPGWGNLWAVFLLITIGSAAFSAFGLIVASVPLAIFPHWIQRAALFMPATYLANGLEAATTNASTPTEVLTDFVALTLGFLVAFEISRRLFRWEPEAKFPNSAKLWALAALVPFVIFGIYENVAGNRLERIQHNFRSLSNREAPPPPSDVH